MNTTTVSDEIRQLETELKLNLDTDTPIDTRKLKRLCDLRVEHVRELADKHRLVMIDVDARREYVKLKTNEMTARLSAFTKNQMTLYPDIMEQIHAEVDKYSAAASDWANCSDLSWELSEASSLLAGILLLANEIR